jgi:hypothetical protein
MKAQAPYLLDKKGGVKHMASIKSNDNKGVTEE